MRMWPGSRGSRRLAFALVWLAALAVGLLALPASAAAAGVTYSFVTEWGSSGTGDGQFALNDQSPWGIALDAQGNVFVADAYNYRIEKFSSTGTFLCQFGTEGAGAQQLNNPYDVAVSSDGTVYVLDSYNNRVQVFTSVDGGSTYGSTARWAIPNANTSNEYRGIACDDAGNVYVTNDINDTVVKLNSSGALVTTLAGDPKFITPDSVAVDPDGKTVYVSDWGHFCVQVYTAGNDEGTTYVHGVNIGSQGSGDGQFNGLAGVAVDGLRRVYVCDKGDNNRIQVFAPNDVNGGYSFLTKLVSWQTAVGKRRSTSRSTSP